MRAPPCIKQYSPYGLKRVALGRVEAPTWVFLRGMAGHHTAPGPQYPRRWKRQKRPAEGQKERAEMDGMTDREYVDGVEPYVVVAGECPSAPAGSIVKIFPHVGWSEAGEVVTYAGVDGRGGVTFGRVLDVLSRGGAYRRRVPNGGRAWRGRGGWSRPRVAAPPRPPQALGSLGGPHAATPPPRGISRGHGYARPLPRAALTPPAVP